MSAQEEEREREKERDKDNAKLWSLVGVAHPHTHPHTYNRWTSVKDSVTRCGELLDFGQIFKAFGNN